ncbi:MAG: phosphopantetheine-binding protein [Nitrospirales bacterium]|nr:phosphopantetheine-binding protein [Nitrospirales bacterium]MDR4481692.1 phosphopantetheine-binding protein [Nitrospirales bacterium]
MEDVFQRINRLTEPQRKLLRIRLGGMRGERKGELRLVGYVVPRASEAPTVQKLRGFLAERLPDYMVPATWIVLDSFPLTSRGKVDRKALQNIARSASEGPSLQKEAPRNDCERDIAAIWKEALGLRVVGLQDNFFDLGGHSLLLPKVLAQVRALTRREVEMVDLFRYPTVQALASFVSEDRSPIVEEVATQQVRSKREAGVRRMKQQRRQRQSAVRGE